MSIPKLYPQPWPGGPFLIAGVITENININMIITINNLAVAEDNAVPPLQQQQTTLMLLPLQASIECCPCGVCWPNDKIIKTTMLFEEDIS